jgi:hypothetical protein
VEYSIGTAEDYSDQDDFYSVFRFLDCPLGIFESERIPSAAEEVPTHLRDLICRSEAYPPAIALAKRDLFRRKLQHSAEIVESVTERLEHYVAQQGAGCFVCAKSLSTDSGYRTAEKEYWVVGRQSGWSLDSGDLPVWWVSSDYEVYMSEARHFRLTRQQLERLPLTSGFG